MLFGRIKKWIDAPAQSLPRKFITGIALLCGFAVPMYFWSREGTAGTKMLDPSTLIETAGCNVAGVLLFYVVGPSALSAMTKHMSHPFRARHRHEHCGMEFLSCAIFGAGSSILGGLLVWQTLDPNAKSKGIAQFFGLAVGTPQYYRSGMQSLVFGLGLVSIGYWLVQDIKLRRDLSPDRADIQLAPENARTRPARSREELPPQQGRVMPQGNQQWAMPVGHRR